MEEPRNSRIPTSKSDSEIRTGLRISILKVWAHDSRDLQTDIVPFFSETVPNPITQIVSSRRLEERKSSLSDDDTSRV